MPHGVLHGLLIDVGRARKALLRHRRPGVSSRAARRDPARPSRRELQPSRAVGHPEGRAGTRGRARSDRAPRNARGDRSRDRLSARGISATWTTRARRSECMATPRRHPTARLHAARAGRSTRWSSSRSPARGASSTPIRRLCSIVCSRISVRQALTQVPRRLQPRRVSRREYTDTVSRFLTRRSFCSTKMRGVATLYCRSLSPP